MEPTGRAQSPLAAGPRLCLRTRSSFVTYMSVTLLTRCDGEHSARTLQKPIMQLKLLLPAQSGRGPSRVRLAGRGRLHSVSNQQEGMGCRLLDPSPPQGRPCASSWMPAGGPQLPRPSPGAAGSDNTDAWGSSSSSWGAQSQHVVPRSCAHPHVYLEQGPPGSVVFAAIGHWDQPVGKT